MLLCLLYLSIELSIRLPIFGMIQNEVRKFAVRLMAPTFTVRPYIRRFDLLKPKCAICFKQPGLQLKQTVLGNLVVKAPSHFL